MYLDADLQLSPGVHGGQKGSPGTGITGGCESPSACWELISERAACILNHWASLEPLGILSTVICPRPQFQYWRRGLTTVSADPCCCLPKAPHSLWFGIPNVALTSWDSWGPKTGMLLSRGDLDWLPLREGALAQYIAEIYIRSLFPVAHLRLLSPQSVTVTALARGASLSSVLHPPSLPPDLPLLCMW